MIGEQVATRFLLPTEIQLFLSYDSPTKISTSNNEIASHANQISPSFYLYLKLT